MSYIVLARKYRPQTFDELIGQEHITDILKKSIEAKRIAHAFLFCGPRGIGKTSCARILAKSLNCEKGPTLKPCGECPACREITQSNSFDVIEIDGASNRGIDEIRTLRENVKFAPNYGRYKMYIVDEVHMLTTEAFNALLKTLEEPPPHVKFILATTDPNKVPLTIISRCQRFDFKRISVNGIIKALSEIAKNEKFKIDQDALFAIAKAASGSLRDALSILDQLSALSARNIKAEDVFAMLGMVETEFLLELTDALVKKDCAAALETFDRIIGHGKDIKQLGKDLIEHFRHLMIIKIGGKALGKLVDYPVATKELLLTQAQKFSLKEILGAIEIFIEAQEMTRVVDSLRIPLEIAFARITYSENASAAAASAAAAPSAQIPVSKVRTSPIEILADKKGQVDISPLPPLQPPKPDAQKNSAPEAAVFPDSTVPVVSVLSPGNQNIPAAVSLETIRKSWDAVTFAISREKMSVATFLQEGAPYAFSDNILTISFPAEASFHKETLEEKNNLQLIERAFSDKLQIRLRVQLKIVADYKPHEEEPFIKTALDTFKGKVVNKWHHE